MQFATRRLTILFELGAALILPSLAQAQVPILTQLDPVQHPPGLEWRQIVTPHFRVIFPLALQSDAQRTATLLEHVAAPLAVTLPGQSERLPVVLGNQSMVPNAYVAWAPRRSQWNAIPTMSSDRMGPIDWYTLLGVHEGRHVVQERAMRTGFVRAAGLLGGQELSSLLANALYFPAWFWEGDAVGTETALTRDGRGRQPSFGIRARALALTDRPYTYYPAWHGSYREYYPGWYELGYFLTTHVKRRYGADAWRRIIRRTTHNPITPIALSRALKRETGRTLPQVHRDAIAELDSLWTAQVAGLDTTPVRRLSPVPRKYQAWSFPQYAGDGSIVAEYADLGSVPSLVRLTRDGRRETLVRGIATYGEFQFHVAGNRVVWSEFELDPRWGERDYLVIKSLDLTTRRITRLTSRSRYFGPALSPDATKIVAVHFAEDRRATLTILNAETGREISRVPNADGFFLSAPAWSADGSRILAVAVDGTRGNALLHIEPVSGAVDTLIDWTHHAISRPSARGKHVFYGSPQSGIDNIYALNTETGRRYRVTSRRYAARYPAVALDGARLVMQDYGPHGDEIAEIGIDTAAWIPVESVDARDVAYYAPLIAQEGGQSIVDSIPARLWDVKPYGGPGTLFPVHSWSIVPEFDGGNSAFAVHSRNVLNTVRGTLGVIYNRDERRAAVEAGVSYAGLVPIIDVAVRNGGRASHYTDAQGAEQPYGWTERSATVGVRLPLIRRHGLTTDRLSLGVIAATTRISDQSVDFAFENNNGTLTPLSYSLSASRFGPAASRDLGSKGVFASMTYRHTPLVDDYTGHLMMTRVFAAAPGFARHHLFVADAARQDQRPGNYRFSREARFARGYDSRFHERYSIAGATYSLPLLYPDLALGPWAYFKRVQGSTFADYATGDRRDGSRKRTYRSLGIELTTDVAPLSLRQTIRTGVRYSHRIDDAPNGRFELLVTFP